MALVGIEEGITAYGFPNFMDKAANNLKLHLFTNNHAPAAADTIASYTECTDPSYAAVALTAANWTIVQITGPISQASYPQQTFTFTNATNVYGYYVTDSGSNKVIWAEKFAAAPLACSATVPLDLTPKVTMQ